MQQFNLVTKEQFDTLEVGEIFVVNKTIKCKQCGRSKNVKFFYRKTEDGQLQVRMNRMEYCYSQSKCFRLSNNFLYSAETMIDDEKKYNTTIVNNDFYVKYKNRGFVNTVNTQMVTRADTLCRNCFARTASVLSIEQSPERKSFIMLDSDNVEEISFELLYVNVKPNYQELKTKYDFRHENYNQSLVDCNIKDILIYETLSLQKCVMRLSNNRRMVVDKIREAFYIGQKLYLRTNHLEILPYEDIVFGWDSDDSVRVPTGNYRLFDNDSLVTSNIVHINGCYKPLCIHKLSTHEDLYDIVELDSGNIVESNIRAKISKYLIPIEHTEEEYKKDYFNMFCDYTNIEHEEILEYDSEVYLNKSALNRLCEQETNADTIRDIIQHGGFKIKNYIYYGCENVVVLSSNVKIKLYHFNDFISETNIYDEWFSELEIAVTRIKFKNIWGFMEMF